jgi:hypothetical protein
MPPARQPAIPPEWPSLRRSIVGSLSGFVGAPLRFVVGSLIFGLAVVGVLLLAGNQPLAVIAFGPLLAPLGSGLLRMAASDARSRQVTYRDFGEGSTDRMWPKLGLGLLQIVVLLLAGFNLVLGLRMEGLVGALITAVAAYVLLAVWCVGVTIWPLLADPDRDHQPIRTRLFLGLRVFFARPLQIGAIGLLSAGMLYAGLALLTPLLFVPGLAALLAAHQVLPAADRISPLPDDDRG